MLWMLPRGTAGWLQHSKHKVGAQQVAYDGGAGLGDGGLGLGLGLRGAGLGLGLGLRRAGLGLGVGAGLGLGEVLLGLGHTTFCSHSAAVAAQPSVAESMHRHSAVMARACTDNLTPGRQASRCMTRQRTRTRMQDVCCSGAPAHEAVMRGGVLTSPSFAVARPSCIYCGYKPSGVS